MIKLPSLSTLWQQFRNVLFRFPLQSLVALTAMSLLIWVSNDSHLKNQDQVYKLVALCNLAFTSSLAMNLYAESRHWKTLNSFIFQLFPLVFCAILFFLIAPEFFNADLLNLGLLILAGHLLVSFSTYHNSNKILEFWHFNKTLFLHFITGVIFSIVLFMGLSAALLTVDTLFNYTIRGEAYYKLFITLAVGFNSLFFLAGLPEYSENSIADADLASKNQFLLDNTYPKVLKIFTQYVLIPLLTIYFGILVVYEAKIAINAQLPDGMVSILILGYAVFGILSYLLIYPISKDSGNEWMRQFSNLFFWLMLPLLVLLFIAIGVRVADYGLTEMRYFIIILAFWLFGISLYFITNKAPRIQIIPISLTVLTLLGTYGPQSATSLAKKSQQSRLRDYLPKNNKQAGTEKISIINYLVDFHGLRALQEYTGQDLTIIQSEILMTDSLREYNYLVKSKLRDTAFSILAIDRNSYQLSRQYFNFQNNEKLILSTGSEYIYWFQYSSLEKKLDSPLGMISIIQKDNEKLMIKIGENDSVYFNIVLFEQELLKKYQSGRIKITNTSNEVDDSSILLPTEWMKLEESSQNYNTRIIIQSISIRGSNEKVKSTYSPSFTSYLIITKK